MLELELTPEQLRQELAKLQARVAALESAAAKVGARAEHFRLIADYTYDWEYWVGPDGQLLYNSPSCERITGYPPEAFLADPELLERIAHEDDRQAFGKHSRQSHASQAVMQFEYRIVARDGTVRWLEHVCQSVPGAGGVDLGRRISNREITDRKLTEQQVQKLAMLVENSWDFVGLASLTGELLYLNPAGRRLAGLAEPAAKPNLLEFLPEAERRRVQDELLPDLLRTGRWLGELSLQNAGSGQTLALDVNCFLIQDPVTGRPLAFGSIGRDMRDRRLTEDALRESEARFRRFFNEAAIGMALVSPDNHFAMVNAELCHFLGYTEQELLGRTVLDVTHPDDRRITSKATQEMRTANESIRRLVKRYFHKSGQVRWGEVTASLLRDTMGELGWSVAQVLDITERRQAEDGLRAAAQEWQVTFDSVADAIWVLDEHWLIQRCNKAALAILQRPLAEVLGQPCWELVHGTTQPLHECPLRRMRSSRRRESSEVALGARHYQVTVDPLLRDNGELYGAVHTLSDITERKLAERRQARLSQLKQRLLDDADLNLKLKLLADGVVDILQADFARIWMLKQADLCARGCRHAAVLEGPDVCSDRSRCLHLKASSGRYESLDGSHRRVPLGCYKIGRVASAEDRGFVTNDVAHDPRIHDHAWAQELGLTAFAGRRLVSADGQPVGVLAMFSQRPITPEEERCLEDLAATASQVLLAGLAQEALAESEHRYAMAQRAAGIGSWGWTIATGELQWSDQMEALLGFAGGDFGGTQDAFLNAVPAEDREQVRAALQAALEGTRDYALEHRILWPDGTLRWISSQGEVHRGQQGQPVQMFGIIQDITERKQAEEELRRHREHLADLVALRTEALTTVNDRLQQEIEERERAEAATRKSAKEFENLYNQAPTGFHSLDAAGRFVRINDTELQWLGYTRDELLGKCFSELLTPRGLEVFQRNFPEFKARGWVRDLEFELIRKDGSSLPVLVSATAIYDATGQYLMSRSTVYDISERKRAEQLARAKDAAEEANRAKGRFLANVSHELRTPMNAILGMTELALEERLSATVRGYLQTARTSAQLLLSLLNEILDLSKIEAGKFALEAVPFDLRVTLDETLRLLAERVYRKGLELNCDLSQAVPQRLIGDPLRLRQILLNLVGNAIKFTDRGEILVRVEVTAQTPEQVSLQFQVTDTGIGISQADQERVFAPFTQADSTTTRRHEGTGLGLAIVSSLVHMMDGQLWVQSVLGQGSTFAFRVPFQVAPGDASPPEFGFATQAHLEAAPVLVVVQQLTTRRIIASLLQGWGLQPVLADDLAATRQLLQQAAAAGGRFSLTIVDAHLPDGAGLRLLQQLKDQQVRTGPQLLLLASAADETLAKRCHRLRQVTILEKPVSQAELLRAVTRAIRLESHATPARPAQAGSRRRTPARRASPTARPPRSWRILLAEDTPANQELVVEIVTRHGHQVRLANNGQEALAWLAREEFDLILMDVQMPLLDGFQTTAAIRGLPDAVKSRVPIVAMTAYAMQGDQERCLDAGMNAYLSKPLNSRDLLDVMDRLLRRTAPEAPANPPGTAPQPEGAGESAEFQFQDALARLDGRYELFQKMADFFAQDADKVLGDLQAGLARGDARQLAQSAHRLKNTAVYLSAAPVLAACTLVEQLAQAGDLAGTAPAVRQLEQQIQLLKAALAPHRSSPNLDSR